jgi:hypothetical protein
MYKPNHQWTGKLWINIEDINFNFSYATQNGLSNVEIMNIIRLDGA